MFKQHQQLYANVSAINSTLLRILLSLLLLLSLAFWQIAAAQVIYRNLVVTPASGPPDASGFLRVTITGESQADQETPYPVEWVDIVNLTNDTVMDRVHCEPVFDVDNQPRNLPCPINISTLLGIGTHQLILRSYLYSSPNPGYIESNKLTVTVSQYGHGAVLVAESGVPSVMEPGETRQVWVTMKNSGSATWTVGGAQPFGLGSANPRDNFYWLGSNQNRVPLTTPVAPGDTARFDFTITAPNTEGHYNFQWQMVKDFVEWFGEESYPHAVLVRYPQPTASLDSPSVGQAFPAVGPTANITFAGTATAGRGANLKKIEIITLNESIDVPFTPGATANFNSPVAFKVGTHTVRLKVTDDHEKSTEIDRYFHVISSGAADPGPIATFISPTNGAAFAATGTTARVLVKANASPGLTGDPVSRIDLWVKTGTAEVQKSGIPPGATLDFPVDLPVGEHTLRIRATDTANKEGPDARVNVTVTSGQVASFSVTPTSGVVKAGQTLSVRVTGKTRAPSDEYALDSLGVIDQTTNGTVEFEGVVCPRSFDASGRPINVECAIDVNVNLGVGKHTLKVVPTFIGEINYRPDAGSGPMEVTVAEAPQVPGVNGATYVRQHVPVWMAPGSRNPVSITMLNSGTSIWSNETSQAHRLGSQNPQDNYTWRNTNRVGPQIATTEPGAEAVFAFSVTAPIKPGIYDFQWKMVQDFVEWFGDYTPNVAVEVTYPDPLATFTSPAENARFTANSGTATVTFIGDAVAGKGAGLNIVQLLENGVAFPTETNTSTRITASITGSKSLSLGTHKVELRATDSLGRVASEYRTVLVVPPAPTASFTSPTNNAIITTNGTTANVAVQAAAVPGASASIAQMKFYVDGALVTTGSTSSLATSVTLAAGTHTLGIEAVDNYGTTGLRQNISVNVQSYLPTVTLTAPLNFAYSSSNQVLVKGTTTVPPDGSAIKKIEVLDSGTVLYTEVDYGAVSVYVNLAPGEHRISLRVTDTKGRSSSSQEALVRVKMPAADDAQFVGQDIPTTTMRAGQPYQVKVRMLNTGTTSWESDKYQLGGQNPQENPVFGQRISVGAYKTTPGQIKEFVFDVAPSAIGPQNFQWQMVQGATWFGQKTDSVPISVVTGAGPTVQFEVTNSNISHTHAVYKGTATAAPGTNITKLEVWTDLGDGYGLNPYYTYTATAPTVTIGPMTIALSSAGKLKLRATDSVGVKTESAEVWFNANTSSSTMLGTVSGVRTNSAGNPELYGWTCLPNSAAALSYKVLLDIPRVNRGAFVLAQGVANIASEPDSASVQQTCATPGAGHHFIVDLNPYLSEYAGRTLYVEVTSPDGAQIVTLPCADNYCTMPNTLRVGMTVPRTGDKVQAPNPLFMRMQLNNAVGELDEVGFVVDNQYVPASPDGVPGAYSASLTGLTPRPYAPYTVYAKVRQGKVTVQSLASMVTIMPATPTAITVVRPVNGENLRLNTTITFFANVTGPSNSTKFFLNGAERALSNWTPTTAGTYTLFARSYDFYGNLLAQSPTVTFTAGGGGSTTPGAIVVPHMTNPDAGTLPGKMSVDSSGSANYQIPLVVPPGTNGMQPELSLEYKDDRPNGFLGLGWSVGGLSSIHRCGKTIAQDKINGRIDFSRNDRLCLDGQRLILVNRPLTDDNYWTPGAQYRTEIDTFSRVTSESEGPGGALSFRLETSNGRIATYGKNTGHVRAIIGAVNSGITAPQPTAKSGAQSWAIDRIQDRSGNYVSFSYEQDPTTGEHRPAVVRYGGFNLPAHAAVQFVFKPRPDAWKRYIDETRNDLRNRIENIKTFVGENLNGDVAAAGTLVRDYVLAYEQSPTSGRSLLKSVKVGALNSVSGLMEYLPETTFSWGKPTKSPGFIRWGDWEGGPILTTYKATGPDSDFMRAANHADYFGFSDFDADGLADVLEKRIASPRPTDIDTYEGALRESTNSIEPGTTRNKYRFFHNTGSRFEQYFYTLSTGENFVVLDLGDFNGDGRPDLLVSATSGARICNSPLANPASMGPPGSTIVFACQPVLPYPYSWNNTPGGRAYVFDAFGDGRAAVYSTMNRDGKATYCDRQQACQIDAHPPFVLGQDNDGWESYDGDTLFSSRQYIGFSEMVDFAGIGKPYDVRWTEPFFQHYKMDGNEQVPVNLWHNLAPRITMTSLGPPGTQQGAMADFTYPEYGASISGPLRAPYSFDKPYQGSGLSADFNGSGYNSLAFGFVEIGWDSNIPFNKRAEMTLCLSTGRALDCSVRKKYSGSSYRAIRAVGNFVGDGYPAMIVSPVAASSPASRPTATSAVEVCRVMGDDTTGGTGTNDNNLVCTPWLGLPFPEDAPSAATDQVYFLDLLGTGRPQLVKYHSGKIVNNRWVEDGRWELFESIDVAADGQALDRIYQVRNGLGATETVEYADALPSGVVKKSGNITRTYPQQDATTARKISQRLISSNGVSDSRSISYEYADAAVDLAGRGSLGFATVISKDEQTNIKTTTSYSQDWPMAGMVLSTTTVTTSCELAKTANTPAQREIVHPDGARTYFTYLANSTVTRRDIDPGCSDLGSVATVNEYADGWGNLTRQTVTSSGDGESFVTTTAADYRNDSGRWLIGLPTHTTVTKNAPNQPSLTRTVDFVYDDDTGLLKKETVEPGNSKIEVVTDYYRNSNQFGLVNRKTQTWVDPASQTTKTRTVADTTYDPKGRYPVTVTNALGHTTAMDYYPETGVRKSLLDPNGLLTNWSADKLGRVSKETRPDSNETTYFTKACQSDCPSGAVIAQIVDSFHGTDRITIPEVRYSDSAGHLVRTLTWGFDGTRIVIDQRFDRRGRLLQKFWPRFETAQTFLQSEQAYDDLDRVISVATQDEEGRERVSTTSFKGFDTELTNALGQVRTERRNVLGQVKKVTDPNNKDTSFEYDQFGNLSKTTDPGGNVVTVKYDLLGRKTQLKDPDLGQIDYVVDPLGRVVSQLSPNQRLSNERTGRNDMTRFQYDDLDRMTSRAETDLESRWVFDTAVKGVGQLAEAYTLAGTLKDYRRVHTYDAFGRPDTTSQTLFDGTYSSKQEYDTWGRLARQTYQRNADPAKVFDFRYNTPGYLEKIERAGLVLWKVSAQDASLRPTIVQLGNGLKHTRTYDPFTNRMNGSTLNTSAGVARLQEGYQFDVIGNVKLRSQYWDGKGFQETFEYDNLNRLTKSAVAGKADQIFTYDAQGTGNLTTKTGVGAGPYVYPAQGPTAVRPHAVQSIPGVGSFLYDDNGNLTNGNGRTITWTSFDMPYQIVGMATSSSFKYGPEHQRVQQDRDDAGVLTTLVYAGAQEMEKKGGQVTVKTYWPNGIGVEIDKDGTTQLRWAHVDRLGSVIGYTDQAGNAPETLGYDAWGKRRTADTSLIGGTNTPDSLDGQIDNRGFTGHEMLDKLDLVHMNGRVYDPLVGRFLSGDPIVQDPTNGQSYNRYSYVLNNPTNLTDPTGFCATSGDSEYENCRSNNSHIPLFDSREGETKNETKRDNESSAKNPLPPASGAGNRDAGGDFKLIRLTERTSIAHDGTPVIRMDAVYGRPHSERYYGTPSEIMSQWFAFNPFEQIARDSGASPRQAAWIGFGATLAGNPKQLAFEASAKTMVSMGYMRPQLQHAFKHAKDFGIHGNANTKTLSEFSAVLQSHVDALSTIAIEGTYRGNSVTHFVDPNTALNVIRDASGNFLSGWKLSVQQLEHVLTSGKLGGGR